MNNEKHKKNSRKEKKKAQIRTGDFPGTTTKESEDQSADSKSENDQEQNHSEDVVDDGVIENQEGPVLDNVIKESSKEEVLDGEVHKEKDARDDNKDDIEEEGEESDLIREEENRKSIPQPEDIEEKIKVGTEPERKEGEEDVKLNKKEVDPTDDLFSLQSQVIPLLADYRENRSNILLLMHQMVQTLDRVDTK